MLKAVVLFTVVCSSCAVFSPQRPVSAVSGVPDAGQTAAVQVDSGTGYLVSGPGAGTLEVIGVSGRMRNAEREIDAALDDAARQIALYHGLRGKVTSVLQAGTGYYDFYRAVESEIKPLDEGSYAAYKEALRYDRERDLVRTDNAVFVRCVYHAPGLLPLTYARETKDGEPAWLHGGPVEIPGFTSAVGFAKNHRYLSETIAKSRESAAAALVAGRSSCIITLVADYANRAVTTTDIEINEAELINFMVLETWIEAATGSVWTLAAARERGSR